MIKVSLCGGARNAVTHPLLRLRRPFHRQALMPPLPEETDDDQQLTPAVSKHGADGALPSQQSPQQQHPQVTVAPGAPPAMSTSQPASPTMKLNKNE